MDTRFDTRRDTSLKAWEKHLSVFERDAVSFLVSSSFELDMPLVECFKKR